MKARAARLGLLLSLASVLALALTQCNGCEEEPAPDTGSVASGERHLIGGVPVGTVEGVVRLAEGDDEPSYPTSPFEVPHAGALPDSCTPPQTRDRHPLAMSADRGLSHVGVAATGDPQHWIGPGDPVTHELRIHDCRLDPVTITATTGDRLHITSEVSFPFMPRVGPGMLQAVLPSDPLEAPLDRAGPLSVQCEFTAPCGRAEVLTFHTPVHAVTGEGGHFRIENAPADQELTITAWHPTLAAGTATTRVTEGGTSHVEIVVRRAEAVRPPPRTDVTPGSVDPPSLAPQPTVAPPP